MGINHRAWIGDLYLKGEFPYEKGFDEDFYVHIFLSNHPMVCSKNFSQIVERQVREWDFGGNYLFDRLII